METTLFKITFDDGRKFKIFCANKHQKLRLLTAYHIVEGTAGLEELENGIHTIKQWEEIIKNLNE